MADRAWRQQIATVAMPARVVVVAMLAVALLATACQQPAVDDPLERSTAPILVPTASWRDGFEFTAPPGVTDLYQLRWNFNADATDVVTGWQVASTTTYDPALLTEVPGKALVDEALRAARGEECVVADADLELQLCLFAAESSRDGVNVYLVRLVQNHILVIDYNNIGGDRTSYDPNSLEARFITADFDPTAIDGEIDDYFVSIY